MLTVFHSDAGECENTKEFCSKQDPSCGKQHAHADEARRGEKRARFYTQMAEKMKPVLLNCLLTWIIPRYSHNNPQPYKTHLYKVCPLSAVC